MIIFISAPPSPTFLTKRDSANNASKNIYSQGTLRKQSSYEQRIPQHSASRSPSISSITEDTFFVKSTTSTSTDVSNSMPQNYIGEGIYNNCKITVVFNY